MGNRPDDVRSVTFVIAYGRMTAHMGMFEVKGTGSSGKPWCQNDARSRLGPRGCVLSASYAARSVRTRRSTSAAVNRCQARSADLLSSDACSRYRIDAEAA